MVLPTKYSDVLFKTAQLVKLILKFNNFKLKSLFISFEFNIPGVLLFTCFSAAVEKITIRWIGLSTYRTTAPVNYISPAIVAIHYNCFLLLKTSPCIYGFHNNRPRASASIDYHTRVKNNKYPASMSSLQLISCQY